MLIKNNEPKSRLKALDGLRGFAILAVFCEHTLGIPHGGNFGVDIFFALSGFLISSQLYSELDRTGSISMRAFYRKRCARLIPAFLALVYLYYAITLSFPNVVHPENPLLILSLPLISGEYWLYFGGVALMNHTWTLAFEWQFYLVWPAILVGLFKLGITKQKLLIVIVLAICAIWITEWKTGIYMTFDTLLIGAATPLLADDAVVKRVFSAPRSTWAILIPALAAIVFIVFKHPLDSLHSASAAAVAILTSVIILFSLKNTSWILAVLLENRAIRHFGEISYGLYLYNFPIASVMYVSGCSPRSMFIVGVMVSIPLAELSWRYLEQPLIKRWRSARRMPAMRATGSVEGGAVLPQQRQPHL